MTPKYITVHCSATKPSWSDCDVEDLRDMHIAKGWSDVGYHMIIKRDGTIQSGRPITRQGAHVKGHNADNVGICLIGGVDEKNKPVFNYTDSQLGALRYVLTDLCSTYGVKQEDIKGHRDYPGVAKACPCFDVQELLKEWEA